jgi:hypothetical protein
MKIKKQTKKVPCGGTNQGSVSLALRSSDEFERGRIRLTGTQRCGGGRRIMRKKLGGDNY